MIGLAYCLSAKRPAGWLAFLRCAFMASALAVSMEPAGADAPGSFARLRRDFQQQTRSILIQYCLQCHSTEVREGELDLERFASLDDVRQDPAAWEKIVAMLDNEEMPPEDSEQPTDEQKKRLREWAARYLAAEARANAGDPGPVVLRRLSNAEYTYTVRDLTDVPLNPARQFPTDGAAGEGFSNTGSALVMSPALFAKYVDAARKIADHAVLLPEGFRFSRSVMRRDWVNETLTSIREMYARYTGRIGDADLLNRWDVSDPTRLTISDGRVDLEAYFRVLAQHRCKVVQGSSDWDAIAQTAGLSARYLDHVAQMLRTDDPSSLLLERIRQVWRSADPVAAAAVAAEIRQWQERLWTFHPVGHFGQVRRWQEPATALVGERSFRVPLRMTDKDRAVRLYLVATSAGDGHTSDAVVWRRPHIERPDQPPIPLRDLQAASVTIDKKHGDAFAERSQHGGAGPRSEHGPGPRGFGHGREGLTAEVKDLHARAPSVIAITIPGKLARSGDFVVSGKLSQGSDRFSSVQLLVTPEPPSEVDTLIPGEPIVVLPGGEADARFRRSLQDFRDLFPAAMCYPRIIPVDVVVTLVLFHREDAHLSRLMLNDRERTRLDRLWDKLHYVSRDALKIVTAYEQLLEFATQDDDPRKYKPLGEAIYASAAEFRSRLSDSEPRHLEALMEFAARAFRRPLTKAETDDLRQLYAELRSDGMSHERAIRLTMARVLAAPAFLYKIELPAAGKARHPVSDWELATRLSYFLWSSLPDAELREAAKSGLQQPRALWMQTQRMLRDGRVRRLAVEFACQWLHIRDFDKNVEKSEKLFPAFGDVRGAIYEEAIRFFTHLFQTDGSVLDILNADYTFLNQTLAGHYAIPGVEGSAWRRVENVQRYSRGGVLAQAAFLAAQSGVSRTSPILRGNWVSETLLGERLPRPPKNVPQLPDVVPDGLTERQLIERHSSDVSCAKCHARIDPFGFALEGFDAVGRNRLRDSDQNGIDTRTTLPDGTKIEGLDGLRHYLASQRRQAFVRQFCRKLLGFALGRAVQLSDHPLLDSMQQNLARNNYHIHNAIKQIVLSEQFRSIRGRDYAAAGTDDAPAADPVGIP